MARCPIRRRRPAAARTTGAPPTTLRRVPLAEAEDRRARPRDDFLSEVVHARIDGEPITPHELSSFLFGAIVAGHETTLIAAANLAYQLGSDPALQARLAGHPELAGRAVDESLRHRSPVQNFVRTVTRDVHHGDVDIAAGDKVMLQFGSANRDEPVYADPDDYDIDRYDTTATPDGTWPTATGPPLRRRAVGRRGAASPPARARPLRPAAGAASRPSSPPRTGPSSPSSRSPSRWSRRLPGPARRVVLCSEGVRG